MTATLEQASAFCNSSWAVRAPSHYYIALLLPLGTASMFIALYKVRQHPALPALSGCLPWTQISLSLPITTRLGVASESWLHLLCLRDIYSVSAMRADHMFSEIVAMLFLMIIPEVYMIFGSKTTEMVSITYNAPNVFFSDSVCCHSKTHN